MIYYSAPQILAASDSTGKFVKKQTAGRHPWSFSLASSELGPGNLHF